MIAFILRSIAVAEIIFIGCCCCCRIATTSSFGLLSSTTSSVQLYRNHHQDISVLRLSAWTTSDATTTTTTTSIIDDNSIPKISNEINDTIQDLLRMARQLGPVGIRNSAEEQQRINVTVSTLKDQLQSAMNNDDNENRSEVVIKIRNDYNYTSVPLIGIHDLIYSAAPGSSSGTIGPVYGKVTQTFVNTTTFRNAVELGSVLRIALTANRHVKDETTFIVKFDNIQVSLFGIPLVEKSIRGSGGVWNIIYTGIVYDTNCKKKILLRIMETPSLFIIEQPI